MMTCSSSKHAPVQPPSDSPTSSGRTVVDRRGAQTESGSRFSAVTSRSIKPIVRASSPLSQATAALQHAPRPLFHQQAEDLAVALADGVVVERLDESLPAVVGDSHQLQQVFLNILNNAYDAVRETARPARIEIRSASANPFVEISFRDNGMGIADPERIFDPFFTTKDVGKGTGLGLSICYGIVREHGGEIVCQNNLDSEGATFVVRLPVAAETASFGAVAGVHPK